MTGGGGNKRSSGSQGMPIWLLILIVLLYLGYQLFFADDSASSPAQTPGSAPPAAAQTRAPLRTATRASTLAPAAAFTAGPTLTARPAAGGTGKTWTVMLYEDADDGVLEEDMLMDVNEAERVGSTDRVQIVAQIDRYKKGFSGDGNWTGARRYYLTKDQDLSRINSKQVGDLGEVNMGDPATLVDFVTWAIKTYPADRYALILSDHGMGWPGGWSDVDNDNAGRSSKIPLVKSVGNMLYLMDIDQALGEIRRQANLDKFEFVGMDACLMAGVEIFTALAPHARYAAASQETEPALGWAYTGFLQGLVGNPDATGADLGKWVVQTYIDGDQRILDDKARLDYLRLGSPLGGLMGTDDVAAAKLAKEVSKDVTLTAVDLSAMPGVMAGLNRLAFALQTDKPASISMARTYAENFTNVFDEKSPPSYIDLGDFSTRLAQASAQSETKSAAAQLQAALKKLVIAEKHGPQKAGATGLSIYFPNSSLYATGEAGAASYTAIAKRFADASLWDDFLAFHYTQRGFIEKAVEAVVPASGAKIKGPGAGVFDLSGLTVSSKEAAPDKPVTIMAALRGTNIGYVYLFVGFYDKKTNSMRSVDRDYLESPRSQQINGQTYPLWSDNEAFNLQFKWNPTVFALSDGQNTVVTPLEPERYGASAAEAVYSVAGEYTPKDGSPARSAKLYLVDGKLRQVLGFAGSGTAGAPHEITPQAGDTFTLFENWLEPDGSGGLKTVTFRGDSLTFGSQPIIWKELYAAAGDYVVGFIVTDLDGVSKEVYTQITVK